MRRLAVVAALVASGIVLAADVGARLALDEEGPVVGEVRVLVVLTTWGTEPFDRERVRTVLAESDAFVRASSYGQAWLASTVTPWLRVPGEPPSGCSPLGIARAGRAAAVAAGYDLSAFDRFIYLHPRGACPWSGIALGDDVVLNGELDRTLVVHELGHTFGLAHANTADCSEDTCIANEYGDPYDTMGSGSGDFNAYEKFQLGWLRWVTYAKRRGVYSVDRLERPSTRSQALAVTTSGEQYWFENRGEPARSEDGTEVGPRGVLVHIGPPRIYPTGLVAFTTSNTLVADPAGRGRAALLAGDRFAVPGAFAVTVVSATAARARLRFVWTDKTAPRAPENVETSGSIRRGPSTLEVVWDDAHDAGSGVARYEVRVDGERRRTVVPRPGRENRASLPRLQAGRHVVTVVAVDRAGNRSVAATRRLTVSA